jgi:hypothetical protein
MRNASRWKNRFCLCWGNEISGRGGFHENKYPPGGFNGATADFKAFRESVLNGHLVKEYTYSR